MSRRKERGKRVINSEEHDNKKKNEQGCKRSGLNQSKHNARHDKVCQQRI